MSFALIFQPRRLGLVLCCLIAGCGAGVTAQSERAQVAGRIEVYGDSTIESWNGTQVAPVTVTEAMSRALGGMEVKNFGVSGQQAGHVLPKWDGLMAASSARLIIINWGLNDARDCEPAKFEENMRWIVQHTKRPLVLETPNSVRPSQLVTPEWKACIGQFAGITRKLSQELNLPLIDVYQFTEEQLQRDPSQVPDGLHPSSSLYVLIGEYMARTVRPLLN